MWLERIPTQLLPRPFRLLGGIGRVRVGVRVR